MPSKEITGSSGVNASVTESINESLNESSSRAVVISSDSNKEASSQTEEQEKITVDRRLKRKRNSSSLTDAAMTSKLSPKRSRKETPRSSSVFLNKSSSKESLDPIDLTLDEDEEEDKQEEEREETDHGSEVCDLDALSPVLNINDSFDEDYVSDNDLQEHAAPILSPFQIVVFSQSCF